MHCANSHHPLAFLLLQLQTLLINLLKLFDNSYYTDNLLLCQHVLVIYFVLRKLSQCLRVSQVHHVYPYALQQGAWIEDAR